MLGQVRPMACKLTPDDRREYQATYCNLCASLGSRYGVSTRPLLVYDFASLAWLFEPEDAQPKPFRRLNCLQGGRWTSRGRMRPVDRFLAAISVYACGMKVQDDLQDEPRVRTRLASRWYASTFRKARHDLAASGFDISALEEILNDQKTIEERRESDFEAASRPTGMAYGLVVRHLADLAGWRLDQRDVELVSERIGRYVYLLDAARDCESDLGRSYNPLCCLDGRDLAEVSQPRKLELTSYAVQLLEEADGCIHERIPRLLARWDALRTRLLRQLGVGRKDVTLNVVCCCPCGDGAVGGSSDECGGPCGCCLCIIGAGICCDKCLT